MIQRNKYRISNQNIQICILIYLHTCISAYLHTGIPITIHICMHSEYTFYIVACIFFTNLNTLILAYLCNHKLVCLDTLSDGFKTKNTAKRNMSSAMCASSMYSRLCMKMLSFLLLRARALPRMLYLLCRMPFPV